MEGKRRKERKNTRKMRREKGTDGELNWEVGRERDGSGGKVAR